MKAMKKNELSCSDCCMVLGPARGLGEPKAEPKAETGAEPKAEPKAETEAEAKALVTPNGGRWKGRRLRLRLLRSSRNRRRVA